MMTTVIETDSQIALRRAEFEVGDGDGSVKTVVSTMTDDVGMIDVRKIVSGDEL